MLELAYDTFENTYPNTYPLPGGTSSIVYNLESRRVEQQFMSLIGTIRNCSGGVTPWETWLTCEESVLSELPFHHILQAIGFALGLREEEDVVALVIRVLHVVLAKTLRIPNASHNLTST